MSLTEPRCKKYCRLRKNPPLPIQFKKDGSITKFEGKFNGFSVTLTDPIAMQRLVSMGFFGKANLSRSFPQVERTKTEVLRNRQYKYRKDWTDKYGDKKHLKKVIVVPDSEDEGDYFTNLLPEYQIDGSNAKEEVWLSLEETFFLSNAVGCLEIKYNDKILKAEEMWHVFCETEPHFSRNYVAYYYYRAKNWVVKPGIKFGGDYLLYKEGPPFYHASYVVIIDVIKENNESIAEFSKATMDNICLLRLNRLCETAGKELLMCRLKLPNDFKIMHNNLNMIEIEEIFVKRWIFTQERNHEQ